MQSLTNTLRFSPWNFFAFVFVVRGPDYWTTFRSVWLFVYTCQLKEICKHGRLCVFVRQNFESLSPGPRRCRTCICVCFHSLKKKRRNLNRHIWRPRLTGKMPLNFWRDQKQIAVWLLLSISQLALLLAHLCSNMCDRTLFFLMCMDLCFCFFVCDVLCPIIVTALIVIFKLFGNSLINLPKLSNNCSSEIIADAFPPWHCVSTYLNELNR